MVIAEIDGISKAIKLLGIAFRGIRSGLSKRKQKQLVSEIIRECLKLDPDIDAIEAGLIAAKATGVPPSTELLRAKRIARSVKSHKIGKKKAKKRQFKKRAKKKMVKKKFKKKAAKRKAMKRRK